MPTAKPIRAETLAAMVRSDPTPTSLRIIDVRDDDFEGGHIHTATNVPSSELTGLLGDLVDELKGVEKVVFHCALSQVRGPKAARLYLEAKDLLSEGKKEHDLQGHATDTTESKEEGKEQEVYVLVGGFYEWQKRYGQEKDLTEEWEPEMWKNYQG
ncbi:Cdc25 phosphatase Ibp1 [Saitoella coloradoensis]